MDDDAIETAFTKDEPAPQRTSLFQPVTGAINTPQPRHTGQSLGASKQIKMTEDMKAAARGFGLTDEEYMSEYEGDK
jgi:hypothetical protein